MSALPPKADMCSALAHVCFGPKADIGEQAPKTCFSWAVLQTLQRFGNGLVEIGLEIGRGLHGKMPSRPLAKGERGRAFKAISPGMLPPLGIIFGLFVAFIGRFIHGNEVSPGNLCREPAAVA